MAERKKKKTNNNEVKINIWKIVNFLLIMASVVYMALVIEIVSVAAVAANATKGKEVYVYWSGCSGGHSTISVGQVVRSAYWSGSDVIVILENGQKRKYNSTTSWSSVY